MVNGVPFQRGFSLSRVKRKIGCVGCFGGLKWLLGKKGTDDSSAGGFRTSLGIRIICASSKPSRRDVEMEALWDL